ncbi:hypothetical protein Hanom_Chr07g00642981 [Helianthus anomalus]
MTTVAWAEEEDIALCVSWVEALSNHTSSRHSRGPFWRTIRQHFQAYTGHNNRTVDSLSSRFMTIRLDCETFETIHTAVELKGGDLGDMGEAFKGREGAGDPPNFSLSSGEYVVFV